MPNRKQSALWERIGAARQRSGMSQLAVAGAMGHISRAAVSLWETKNEGLRTTPSSEQLMLLAKVLKLPVELLVDDQVSPTGIAMLPQNATAGQIADLRGGAAASAARAAAPQGAPNRVALFWNTARLAVVDQARELQDCFDVVVERGGLLAKAPFLHKRHIVFMFGQLARTREQFLADELPGILYIRALASRTPPNTLVLVSSDQNGHAELDGATIDDDLCGCRFVAVQQVPTAARLVLAA